MSKKTDVINRTKELSLDAGVIVRAAGPDLVLAQAILTSGMLINEGLHAVADSIEKMGHREIAADTIANAIKLLVQ